MSTAGFVKLQDLTKLPLFRKAAVQPEEVRIVMAGNPKQRFQLRTVDGVESVRAVQGHSSELAAFYQLSDDEMLRRLTTRTAPATAVHGTMHTNYQAILQKGLLRGTRRHLHFVNGDEAERARVQDKELSGFKSSSDILLTFDIRACLNEGIKFYEAPNGVLLSPGRQGRIESRFIISVKVARTGKVVAAQGDNMLPSADDVQWLFASAVGERPPRHSRKRTLRPCAFSETRIMRTACINSLSHLREPRIMRGNARDPRDKQSLSLAQADYGFTRKAGLLVLSAKGKYGSKSRNYDPHWTQGKMNGKVVSTSIRRGTQRNERHHLLMHLHCAHGQNHEHKISPLHRPAVARVALASPKARPKILTTSCRNTGTPDIAQRRMSEEEVLLGTCLWAEKFLEQVRRVANAANLDSLTPDDCILAAAQAARKTAVRLRFDMFPEPSSVMNGQASHLHQQHTSLCKLINGAGRHGRVTGGQSQQICTASTQTLICAGEKEAKL